MATEKRLIWAHKAEELIKNFGKGAIEDGLKSLDPVDDIILLAKGVGFIPTVDAVEVVRCKDCKHCCLDLSGRENHLCMRKEVGFVVRRKANDFYSYGERRTDGNS